MLAPASPICARGVRTVVLAGGTVASAMAAEAMGLMPPKEHYDKTGRVGIGAVSRELRNIESHLALLSSLERREMEAG